MKRKVAIMVSVLLGFLILGQSIYLTSQIDVDPNNEPIVSSITAIQDINAAHITEPATLPVVHEYKTDIHLLLKVTIVHHPAPIAHSFQFHPNVTESFGFLDVRKYQSNYLS